MDKIVDYNKISSLDEFYASTQVLGNLNKAVGNNMYGINHRSIKGVIPENRDSYGYVFFTRPQLNLSTTNLRNIRKFYSLLTNNQADVKRYIRCQLDPRLRYADINSILSDPLMPFLPVLSNNIVSMSGWPDIVLPTFTSKEGVRREQWSIGDGSTEIFESFDLDCTFRNSKDEPIIQMIQTWVNYIAYAFEGMLSPYMDFITENEIDYNTRIYRLVMDENKRFVKKIAATGASFPINDPTGKFFDFSNERNYNDQTKEINIRFKSNGAMYNDDILVKEFNETVAIFNPAVRNMLAGKSHSLEQIPEKLLVYFNNRGYPVINTKTLELGWWVDKNSATYSRVIANLK